LTEFCEFGRFKIWTRTGEPKRHNEGVVSLLHHRLSIFKCLRGF
jgi:hypothetical protein